MTSMTWERHRGHADTYDVVDIGFNYRIDEPRAALALSRLRRLEPEIESRRELTRQYRERLEPLSGIVLPYTGQDVERSSCYVMPIMLAEPERRSELRRALSKEGIQTSILYPAIHEFSAYRARFPDTTLPRTELAARSELTLPLYPHMTRAEHERVVREIERAFEA